MSFDPVTLVNREEFVRFGKDYKSGKFKKMNKNSYEYKEMWQEQLDRCHDGYTVGGLTISGFMYWYSNFGTIDILSEDGRGKHKGTPLLRDIEVIIDREITDCQSKGLGLMIMTGRRGGKSFIGSGLLAHNALIHQDSGLIASYNKDKGEAMAKMCKTHLNGMAGTEMYVPILKGTDISKEMILGFESKDPTTKKMIPNTTGGVIHKRLFVDDHQAANGLSARITVFEEVGIFNNLIKSFDSTKYLWTEGTQVYGFFLLIGTGGDMEKGTVEAAAMFQEPEIYGLKTFEDPENPVIKTGLFIPAQYTLNNFKDKEGNTNLEAATEDLLKIRENLKKAKKLDTLYAECQFRPLNWREVFLKSGGNRFNSALIQDQLTRISSDKALQNIGIRGKMVQSETGHVKFEPDAMLREVDWPVKLGEPNLGCVVIYERPYMRDNDPKSIPAGLYIAGTDPYAEDSAPTSHSLGSTFIYKRIATMDQTHNIIVAEYTGRPAKKSEYSAQLRLLLLYYNAVTMFENNRGSIKQDFEQMKSLHLLSRQPGIIKLIQQNTQQNQPYGYHSTEPINEYRLDLLHDWLEEERGDGVYNVNYIYSVPFLTELLKYDRDLNFDRVDAFSSLLLKDADEFRVRKKEREKTEDKKGFFSKMLDNLVKK